MFKIKVFEVLVLDCSSVFVLGFSFPSRKKSNDFSYQWYTIRKITLIDITSIHSLLTPLRIMLCQGNCKKFQGSVLHKLFAKVDNVQSFQQKSAAATKKLFTSKDWFKRLFD